MQEDKLQCLSVRAEFSEVGAGVQLGPNVTRILQAWGLGDALKHVAAFPAGLQARSMNTGEVLAIFAFQRRGEHLRRTVCHPPPC